MKRNIISLEEASIILEPHYSNIVNSIVGGFEDYQKISEFANTLGRPVTFGGCTKGSLIHDQIRVRITEQYEESNLFEARKWNNIFALKLEDDVLIRFKKLDKNKGIANYRTEQHIKFMAQSLIDGFPDQPTFLFAGYIPDKTWTSIRGVYIACWNGKTIEWFDEIGKYCVRQLNIFEEPATEELEKRFRVRLKNKFKIQSEQKTGTNE
ncbi:hypothetical protein ABID42_000547 [Arcicella rosea]|uniref:hypothetical protein n=1 Tax=Arcicella rosea TaxID=502909 RepID=UPI00345C745C